MTDQNLATVTATKLQSDQIRITVREREGERLTVRANARLKEKFFEGSVAYQDFFAALDKSMF